MHRKAMSTTGISVIATVQARRARNRRRVTRTPPSRCATDFHDDLDYQGRAVQWRLAASRNPSLIGRPGARAPAPSQGLQTFEQPSQPTGPPISLSDCIGDFVDANGSRATSAVPTDRSLTARFSRGLSDRNWPNTSVDSSLVAGQFHLLGRGGWSTDPDQAYAAPTVTHTAAVLLACDR